jgi:hypothetical protein
VCAGYGAAGITIVDVENAMKEAICYYATPNFSHNSVDYFEDRVFSMAGDSGSSGYFYSINFHKKLRFES